MNYKLNISYDGTSFCGWQKQKNDRTIQEEIEIALGNIFSKKKINLIGSGRTDAGVHALNQIANFSINTSMTEKQIGLAINSKLQKDIYINLCEKVDDEFHSRYSAVKREYIYKLTTEYSPLNRQFKWYLKTKINKDLLIKCSKLIRGEHDFKNFCKFSTQKENNICEIFESKWEVKNNYICYKICANRFLHHMVRMLVGTMIEVSKEKISLIQFNDILNKKVKLPTLTAPAHGLFLSKVYYK